LDSQLLFLVSFQAREDWSKEQGHNSSLKVASLHHNTKATYTMYLFAALIFPILQSNAFSGHIQKVPSRISLRTATNPFEAATIETEAISDIYSSTTVLTDSPPFSIKQQCSTTHGLVEYCSVDGEEIAPSKNAFIESILSSYLGPRLVLAAVAILYATNFSLGAIMNDNLPASAATSSRMVLASLVLSPFLLQLKPNLRWQVLIGGGFVSLGYITQVGNIGCFYSHTNWFTVSILMFYYLLHRVLH
jgi:hypothetical protein